MEIEQETKIGIKIADILMLRKGGSKGRYKTLWGDKTAVGIYKTVIRVAKEAEAGTLEI